MSSGNMIPSPRWQLKDTAKSTRAPVPAPAKQTPPVVIEQRTQMVEVRRSTAVVRVMGENFEIDPSQFIRMIRQITQTIGEYKAMDNVYGRYVIPALRKARSDMVSDLENKFGIHWEIDSNGNSRFYK